MRVEFESWVVLLAVVVLCGVACSGSASAPLDATNSNAGTTSGGASTANGGANASSGAAGTNASSAGTAGTADGSGGGAGESSAGAGGGGVSANGGASASSGAGGTTMPASNFTCSECLGLLTTDEWYSQGFENDGVDGTKWQLKYHHYGYVNTWADPNSVFWSDTGDSFDLTQGSAIQSPCSVNSNLPDRLVFAALDWEMSTEDQWVSALEAALATFEVKYPSLRRVELMTMIRCPGNQKCNPNEDYGPGANMSAARQDCYVPPFEDSAIAKVAAAHPDFVAVGPQVEALACKDPVDGAHLSVDSNQHAAQAIATYYAARP